MMESARETQHRRFGSLLSISGALYENRSLGLLTVKCKRQQAHSAFHPENLVHDSAFRIDPAWEGEVACSREDEVREPIPAEGYAEGDAEESVSGKFPSCVSTTSLGLELISDEN